MQKLTALMISALAAGVQAAPTDDSNRPSTTAYFQHAVMDQHCRPGATTPSPALETYRLHTLAYFRSGAKGAPPQVAEGAARAVQDLERNEIPADVTEKFKKVFAKMTPAQRERMCQTLPQLIDLQIQIENLKVARDQQGR